MRIGLEFLLVGAVLVVTVVSRSLAAGTQPERSKVVASVGDSSITFGEFSDRYEDYLIYTGLQDNMQARYAILNNMINEILLRHYDDNRAIYSNAEYQREIASAWKRSVLAFVEDREVYAKITVSDREMREAYERSKIKLAVRHLFARTEKEADELYHLAKIGVSFHQLAKQVFTDTTLRNNGGYLGYIGWGETDPNFERVAYSLKVGEISRPVKTAEGYSIIRVDDRIDDPFATEYGYETMKHKLARAIRIDKKKSAEDAYLARVFDTSAVRFNQTALETVLDGLKQQRFPEIERTVAGGDIPGTCVSYKGHHYGTQQIERMILETPLYDRSLLTNVDLLRKAIVGLLMQDVLLDTAKAKGFDTTSSVRDAYAKLANDVYLNYKRNEVLSTVPVSDSEIVKYYRENISYYTTEKEMNVQEIVVDNDSEAIALRRRVDEGEDFGTLAERYSLRKMSARNKGMLGLAPFSRFGSLKDTLWNLAQGTTLGPVKFDKYLGIFRVVEKKDGTPIALDLVRDQIVKAVKNEKGYPYMKARLAKLSKETNVTVDDDAIKNFAMQTANKK